jgi:hypothetical protein
MFFSVGSVFLRSTCFSRWGPCFLGLHDFLGGVRVSQLLSFTVLCCVCCFVCFCPVSYVSNVSSQYGLSILDCSFGVL